MWTSLIESGKIRLWAGTKEGYWNIGANTHIVTFFLKSLLKKTEDYSWKVKICRGGSKIMLRAVKHAHDQCLIKCMLAKTQKQCTMKWYVFIFFLVILLNVHATMPWSTETFVTHTSIGSTWSWLSSDTLQGCLQWYHGRNMVRQGTCQEEGASCFSFLKEKVLHKFSLRKH